MELNEERPTRTRTRTNNPSPTQNPPSPTPSSVMMVQASKQLSVIDSNGQGVKQTTQCD